VKRQLNIYFNEQFINFGIFNIREGVKHSYNLIISSYVDNNYALKYAHNLNPEVLSIKALYVNS